MFAKSSILVKRVYCQKVLLLRTSTPNKSVKNKWIVLCYLCDDVTHNTLLKCQNIMNNEFQLILKYGSLLSMFCKNMYVVSLFVWRIAAMIVYIHCITYSRNIRSHSKCTNEYAINIWLTVKFWIRLPNCNHQSRLQISKRPRHKSMLVYFG